MNSKHSAKSRHSSENIAPNCMKSKTKRMMYMSSSSPNSLKKKKDCIELIKIKEIMHELEKTTDAAEHVGKILKSLIVKYA